MRKKVKKKFVRVFRTLKLKKEIVKFSKKNSVMLAAKKFKVPYSTIYLWLSKGIKWSQLKEK